MPLQEIERRNQVPVTSDENYHEKTRNIDLLNSPIEYSTIKTEKQSQEVETALTTAVDFVQNVDHVPQCNQNSKIVGISNETNLMKNSDFKYFAPKPKRKFAFTEDEDQSSENNQQVESSTLLGAETEKTQSKSNSPRKLPEWLTNPQKQVEVKKRMKNSTLFTM